MARAPQSTTSASSSSASRPKKRSSPPTKAQQLEPAQPHIIAVVNQKGGVGKTTTAVNLAASIATAEKRTLLIDMDPQGNASSGVGARGRIERSIYDCLIGQSSLESILLETPVPGLFLAPATQDLVGTDFELVDHPDRAVKLKNQLTALQASPAAFEYIFIDCPPSLGLLTLNALTAAETVLVPLQCEYFALEGLTHLMATIDRVKGGPNPDLDIDGIVLTMFDSRNNLAHQVAEEVRKHFRVFNTIVPRNVRLSEAPSHGKPVLLYDAQSKGTQAYLSLAHELLKMKAPSSASRSSGDTKKRISANAKQ